MEPRFNGPPDATVCLSYFILRFANLCTASA